MAGSSFGELFRFTTWGESHGPAIGAVVDGVPPRLPLAEPDIQHWLDRRKPGQSKFTTQRQEPDRVQILSGMFEGVTTGTPVSLLIRNEDQRSQGLWRDQGPVPAGPRRLHLRCEIWPSRLSRRRPLERARDRIQGRGRRHRAQGAGRRTSRSRGYLVQIGADPIDRAQLDLSLIERNPFWCPDAGGSRAMGAAAPDHPQVGLLGRCGDRGRRRPACRRAWASRSTTSSMPTSPRP